MKKLTYPERTWRRRWFEAEVKALLWDGKCFGHVAARFKAQLGQYGVVKTAKKLLNSERNGKKIMPHIGKWSSSIEHLVVRPAFQPLFTKKEVAKAQERIKAS